VLGADVAFIRAERLPGGGLPKGYFEGAPDLAVEIVSAGDTASEVEEKVRT
jgi:Uma2 family endonuclease